jgi:hypothetical protein
MKGRLLAGLAAGAWLCLVLVACSSGGAAATPTSTGTGGATPPASQATSSGPTATPFGNGTPGGELGAADVCSATGNVSASLPSTIPIYPNAQMRVGSVNGSSGVFGLCIADTVQNVDAYYAVQLPNHGWQKVTDYTLDTSRQITASQTNTSLVLTILPDAAIPADVEVIIILSGS